MVVKRVRRSRNAVAHPEEVHVDTIRNGCSGFATELKLLNVLLEVADDKTLEKENCKLRYVTTSSS